MCKRTRGNKKTREKKKKKQMRGINELDNSFQEKINRLGM